MFHAKSHETTLPVYISLMLHAETQNRRLVDKLSDKGLSIPYNRVLEISTDKGNMVGARFEAEKIVCPSYLNKKLFTVGAVDNIDHNPSSTTAMGSLHGTGISLFQHFTPNGYGEDRTHNFTVVRNDGARSITPLPSKYAEVSPEDPWKK